MDGGQTWSKPHTIGVWGLPSHLLQLKDGRLLMSYGYRRSPWGNQARVSEDKGRTWSSPITISDDGPSNDLGYPSTVELSDGSLLTVWYEVMAPAAQSKTSNPQPRPQKQLTMAARLDPAVLRQAHWSLG